MLSAMRGSSKPSCIKARNRLPPRQAMAPWAVFLAENRPSGSRLSPSTRAQARSTASVRGAPSAAKKMTCHTVALYLGL